MVSQIPSLPCLRRDRRQLERPNFSYAAPPCSPGNQARGSCPPAPKYLHRFCGRWSGTREQSKHDGPGTKGHQGGKPRGLITGNKDLSTGGTFLPIETSLVTRFRTPDFSYRWSRRSEPRGGKPNQGAGEQPLGTKPPGQQSSDLHQIHLGLSCVPAPGSGKQQNQTSNASTDLRTSCCDSRPPALVPTHR